MPFLVVAGLTVHVQKDAASQLESERVGSTTRAFTGRLRSTVRAEKRAWKFTTKHILPADEAALRAAVAGGALVDCSGDALGATVKCDVVLGETAYVQVRGGFRRVVPLTLREV